MEKHSDQVLSEQGLARMGYVVLIALFILSPPPKQPVVLVVALLLAYIFLLQWAWPWGKGGTEKTLAAVFAPIVLLIGLGWAAWPHPRLHLSDQRLIKGPQTAHTIGMLVSFTNEGDDAEYYPYGHGLVLANVLDNYLVAARFAACVQEGIPDIDSFIPLNSEDGLSAPIMAPESTPDDYDRVMSGRAVLFVAGVAIAKADGVTRRFPFCEMSTGGAMNRCAEVPSLTQLPPYPQCLANPMMIAPGVSPNPLPAPYPTSPY